MIRKILAICIACIFLLTSIPVLSVMQLDANISEVTVDNIPPWLDSAGISADLLNMDHPEGRFLATGHDPDGLVVKYFIDYEDGFIDESEWMMNGSDYWINHTFPINVEEDYLVQIWCIDVDNESSFKVSFKIYVRQDRSKTISFNFLNRMTLDLENPLLKPDDSMGLIFLTVWGKIIYNGETYFNGHSCYNITPINL